MKLMLRLLVAVAVVAAAVRVAFFLALAAAQIIFAPVASHRITFAVCLLHALLPTNLCTPIHSHTNREIEK